jgi:predicted NBD/HSP70 family sugar kinase
MLKGTNLQYAKSYNIRIVLESIRLYGPVSRIDLARRTNLTAQTVTNITRELLKAGLIQEAQRSQEGRGAPSILLQLNPDGAFSIGMDLDKDHMTAVLVDMTGAVRQRTNLDLHFPSPEDAMVLFENTAQSLITAEKIEMDRIWGIGVGLPGPLGISEGSVITRTVNARLMPGWHNIPVAKILSDRMNIPVYLENNASAAALGERWYGEGRHIGNFFYVYFGAGLGGGMVINGQLHSGHTGNAGELGYFPTLPIRKSVGEGKIDHLGTAFNLPLLYKGLREQGHKINNASGLEYLYNEKDPFLMDWVQKGASQLTPLILAVEYIMDPEAIFFGGRIPDNMMKGLLELIKIQLPVLHIEEKALQPKLTTATAGLDAAALGVAILPLYTTMAPLPKVLMKKNGPSENSLRTYNK